jgi:proliferating cell nuclear antigen
LIRCDSIKETRVCLVSSEPEMLVAKMKSVRMLKAIAASLKDEFEHVVIECGPEGMKAQVMDASSVCLASLEIGLEGFDGYECPEPVALGINVPNLDKMLSMCKQDDPVLLKAERGGDRMLVESVGAEETTNLEVKLFDIAAVSMGVPKLDPGAYGSLNSADLSRKLRNFSHVGDSVTVSLTRASEVDPVRVGLATSSIELGSVGVSVSASDGAVSSAVSQTFSLRHMNSLLRASVLSDTVVMGMSKDMPMSLCFSLPGGRLLFYIAPKIEDPME